MVGCIDKITTDSSGMVYTVPDTSTREVCTDTSERSSQSLYLNDVVSSTQ